MKELTESEKAKIKKMVCPECNDALRKESVGDKTYLVCVNYYCRWEICTEDIPEEK